MPRKHNVGEDRAVKYGKYSPAPPEILRQERVIADWRARRQTPNYVPLFNVVRGVSDPGLKEISQTYVGQFYGQAAPRYLSSRIVIMTQNESERLMRKVGVPEAVQPIVEVIAEHKLNHPVPVTIANIAVRETASPVGSYLVSGFLSIDDAYRVWSENEMIHNEGFGVDTMNTVLAPHVVFAIAQKSRVATDLASVLSRTDLLGYQTQLDPAQVVQSVRMSAAVSAL